MGKAQLVVKLVDGGSITGIEVSDLFSIDNATRAIEKCRRRKQFVTFGGTSEQRPWLAVRADQVAWLLVKPMETVG